jgi:hypothetical protein
LEKINFTDKDSSNKIDLTQIEQAVIYSVL